MKKVLNQYKVQIKIGFGIVGLIVLIWVLSFVYGIWHESNLLKKYAEDPERKQFVEWILKDKQVLANNPERAQRIGTTMDVGLQWYILQEYKLAIKWWKKGLAIEPNNDIGWYNAGNAYRELKRYSQAENAYEKSMEISGTNEIDACLALGEMYRYNYLEKQNKEDNVYLKCLKKSPDNRDLIARLAGYYRDIGDRKNAIKYFDKLWSIEPTQGVSEELRALRLMAE